MTIRKIKQEDKNAVIQMMQVFYASPAVHTDGSEEIFQNDVDACLSNSPYLEGYILEEQGAIAGYAMVAKSFSTEFGKPCIWLEDIYVKEEYQGMGFGSNFLAFLWEKYQNAVIRLEAEAENKRAVHIYEKSGFESLPYLEMIKF